MRWFRWALLGAVMSGPALGQTRPPEEPVPDVRASIEKLQRVVGELQSVVQFLRESRSIAPTKRSPFLVPSVSSLCVGAGGGACNTQLMASDYCKTIGYGAGVDHDVRALGAGRLAFGAVCYDP